MFTFYAFYTFINLTSIITIFSFYPDKRNICSLYENTHYSLKNFHFHEGIYPWTLYRVNKDLYTYVHSVSHFISQYAHSTEFHSHNREARSGDCFRHYQHLCVVFAWVISKPSDKRAVVHIPALNTIWGSY